MMENYQEKAKENFYRNRPYGIHIDYAQKGFVLFNHYINSLGKQETGSIEGLPLEKFEDVDAIPLNGKIIKNGNQRGRKINCVMRRFFPSSSVGDRPAPRGCTSTPDERKVTTI